MASPCNCFEGRYVGAVAPDERVPQIGAAHTVDLSLRTRSKVHDV